MHVHALGWIVLAVLVLALITIDIFGHVRSPHRPTTRESARWTAFYISLALVFGAVMWLVYGAQYAGEFYAGYITEYSLSVDNLFVFILIISAFRVPRELQQQVVLAGIVIALVFRLGFILLGAAAIDRFSWVFYIFGAFLLYTAISQLRQGSIDLDQEEYQENAIVRTIRRVVPVWPGFLGGKLVHRSSGMTYITPMLICIFALGSADIMFAVDSIPAIFGLTTEPYIVFAANAFALLGLRQLYFLIDSLLAKLVFLPYGLAAILGFIGVKLILHALHANDLGFVNDGEPVTTVPEPGIVTSLLVIVAVMAITVLFSVWHDRRMRLKRD